MGEAKPARQPGASEPWGKLSGTHPAEGQAT
jgi:hypothetical protein